VCGHLAPTLVGMRVVRLLVLGTLSTHGPMYGHQIRRVAEMINVEAWSEIRPGSLYHALHQLQAEGLIEAVRTEQSGRLPARTVYAITTEGTTELRVLRERGLREIHPPRDPFDVALWVAVGLPAAELEFILRQRLEAIRLQLDALVQEREQGAGNGSLPSVGLILMRHGEVRLEAELRWHAELLERLPELAASMHGGAPQG
jgi:DNA-binding PadR family transcriptional regulator